MITLYKARLKALAEDPTTQKYLESKYDWYPDMHISYADRLRLEKGDKDPQFKRDRLIEECRENAVKMVLGYLEDSGRDWSYIERNMLSHVLQDPNTIRAFTSSSKITWQDLYESVMPALIKCVRFPQLAQKVVDVMGTLGITEDEAEAVLAMDMAIKLLHEFYKYIKKDLKYYSEKYAEYMVYSEVVGGLVEGKAELLGRLTAWNHRITSGTESAFLIIATWEPGKEHKSAYRYYLVKE